MGTDSDLTEGIGDDDDDEGVGPVSDAVLGKVISVVSDVLRVPRAKLDINSRAGDVEGWDSFGHVRIVLAIDAAFKIRLSMGAIEKADSVAGLVEAVEAAQDEV